MYSLGVIQFSINFENQAWFEIGSCIRFHQVMEHNGSMEGMKEAYHQLLGAITSSNFLNLHGTLNFYNLLLYFL